MVTASVGPERTPLEKEHERQDRNAWIFAVALVVGCAIPIGGAMMFRSPLTAPVVAEAAGTPAAPHAPPAHGSH